MEYPLSHRINVCSICLKCLKCDESYGTSCLCESIIMYWSRNISETKKFRTKTLTQEAARKRNNKFDQDFVVWFWSNVSQNLEISSNQSLVNICKSCLNKFNYIKCNFLFFIYGIFILRFFI